VTAPNYPLRTELKNTAAFLEPQISFESAPVVQPVPIGKIQLPDKQPRRYFDPKKLDQLVTSVREFGILEPLLVRSLEHRGYELVAGERRLRAAKVIGLSHIPVIVRDLDQQQAKQVALMENLQREDLNPIEETEAILELLAIALGVGQTEVISTLHQVYNAQRREKALNQNVLIQYSKIESLLAEIGRFNAGTFRSSRLPLLNLPADLLECLRNGELEYTKAQAVARVKDETQRKELLQQIIANEVSLSEIKARIKAIKPNVTEKSQKALAQRWREIGRRLMQSNAWSDSQKTEQILELLNDLERLAASKKID
jgi:ParB family transcriptional regulator, chromosome partitioning protein